jgi:hypothetical protein
MLNHVILDFFSDQNNEGKDFLWIGLMTCTQRALSQKSFKDAVGTFKIMIACTGVDVVSQDSRSYSIT